MNPEKTQAELSPTELTPEDAKAALGLSTRLSEQMLMAQAEPMEGQETPETAPGEELELDTEAGDIDTKLSEMEERLSQQIESIKSEVSDNGTAEEIASIREELKSLLKEDDKQETEN